MIALAWALEPDAWIAPSTHVISPLAGAALDVAAELEADEVLEVVLPHAARATVEMAMATAIEEVLRRFTGAFRIIRSAAKEPSIHITTPTTTAGSSPEDCE